MGTRTSPDGQQERHDTRRRIVVGVDTRGRSVSAVVWAVEDAERDGTPLTLVSARRETPTGDPVGAHDLGTLARRLTLNDVERREVVGEPVEVLLAAAAEADLVAVGCRSMRPGQRLVMGSTSRAVACWSPVPVVVVPEAWMQPTMATAPLVVGVRPAQPDRSGTDQPDREVLDFAFARATALKVPLVAVSAWEIASVAAWSPEDVESERRERDDALELLLAPWQETYPEVELVVRSVAEEPDRALLDASGVAQMVVVGRHHGAALSGRLGGTARGVLRHLSRPVAIVPAGTREQLVHELDLQRALGDRPWGPTF